jgi:hypothetical protein
MGTVKAVTISGLVAEADDILSSLRRSLLHNGVCRKLLAQTVKVGTQDRAQFNR